MQGLLGRVHILLVRRARFIIFGILIIQPILDVLSYFLSEAGDNTISTVLRLFLLGFVAIIGYAVSDDKRVYYIFYGVMIGFWLVHTLNCFRIGYISFFSDTANYLRIINYPIFVLSFISLIKAAPNAKNLIYATIAVNFCQIALFTALPWAMGTPIYTYPALPVGVMGWAAIENCQAVLLVILTPFTIYMAYKKNIWMFIVSCILTFGMLFITGTKLDYFSMFIIIGAFMVIFIVNLKKKSVPYVIILFVFLGLIVGLRPVSQMQIRENMSAYSRDLYEKEINEKLSEKDKKEIEDALTNKKLTPEERMEKLRKMRRKLLPVYGQIYEDFLYDLNDRFGVYNVMEAYKYASSPYFLSDLRLRKSVYARLVMQDKDILTRILGFEYEELVYNGNIYDLENDLPSIFFSSGYLGFLIYIAFLGYFFYAALRAFIRNPKEFLTIEMGIVGMSFLLAVIASQVTGYVLRRPNVSVYFAATTACLYYLTVIKIPEKPKWLVEWDETGGIKGAIKRRNGISR